MNEPIDLLQTKIEKAREQLPEATRRAIDNVNWREVILKMRERRGFTIEQLGDLELETELLLAGLVSPEAYPKELANRMEIQRTEVDSLVKEMNDLVFKKIREELIKIREGKSVGGSTPSAEITKNETQTLKSAGIEITPTIPLVNLTLPELNNGNRDEMLTKIERPELIDPHPISTQKLAGSFQIPAIKTDHSVDNLSRTAPGTSGGMESKKISVDPYRELPE